MFGKDWQDNLVVSQDTLKIKNGTNNPTILEGVRKKMAITVVQRLLVTQTKENGAAYLTINNSEYGKFTNDTLAAIKDFQEKKKITVDGIVGKQTFGKFFENNKNGITKQVSDNYKNLAGRLNASQSSINYVSNRNAKALTESNAGGNIGGRQPEGAGSVVEGTGNADYIIINGTKYPKVSSSDVRTAAFIARHPIAASKIGKVVSGKTNISTNAVRFSLKN